jgi:Domain of unknown function (DUF1906)
MPVLVTLLGLVLLSWFAAGQQAETMQKPSARAEHLAGEHLGFDRNDYPGDAALATLRQHFSFVGYWLTNPPRTDSNSWIGKREVLMREGFGFLLLAKGREDGEITNARNLVHATATVQGHADGAAAAAAAKREHFPAGAIIFLDQEEGGRMTENQLGYLRGWTQSVTEDGYRPGVYGSGRPVNDGPGKTITTAQDIRARVDSELKRPIALWVYQDGCPPSNGCSERPPALSASGTPDAEVWQFAQSPRRKDITNACAKTYAADNMCYVPELPGVHLDLDVARSGDPSHGR